jgi:hypothetical protein
METSEMCSLPSFKKVSGTSDNIAIFMRGKMSMLY